METYLNINSPAEQFEIQGKHLTSSFVLLALHDPIV